jgi:hypothetical protein
MAGQSAAEARRLARINLDRPAFRIGASAWSVTGGLALEGNDNIGFDSARTAADLITRPQLATEMSWNISERNSLEFGLGTGYSAYLAHPDFNRFFISPGSALVLDVYSGDFWINLHERLSVTENAYEDPTLVSSADYSQVQNVAGMTTTWDLNQLAVTVGYDHGDYRALSGGSATSNGDSDTFTGSIAYRAHPKTQYGIETGGGLIGYARQTGLRYATDFNIGAFVQSSLTEYIHARAAAGYTAYTPNDGTPQGEYTGFYARLGLNHRLNQYLDYDLTGGRNISFGFFAGTIDLYDAVLQLHWHFFEKLIIETGFQFEHGSQVLFGEEKFDRFGPRVSLRRSISAKMSAGLRYQFFHRDSNQPGGDYEMNLVIASLDYHL